MRITFVLPTASLGGGTRVVAEYAQRLQHAGHQVAIVSQPNRKPSFRENLRSFAATGRWPAYQRTLQSHLDGKSLDHSVLDRMRPVTDGDLADADVVIATWWETAEWVAALGPRKGAKVYFVQHHEIFPYLPVEKCRATYSLPLHKVVVSHWLQKVMREEYGDNDVDVVPNSVDRKQFWSAARAKQQVPTVGFLYSYTAFKRIDLILEAIRIARERVRDLKAVCFGSEPISHLLPLPDYVTFTRSPPQDQIRTIYGNCDAWISASTSEGFNLPAMEAMACRTPVISTKTGWPEEAVRSGWNGELVPFNDAGALADAICSIVTLDEARWQTMSENAHGTVEASSWDASARQFEAALLRAVAKAASAPVH